MSTNKFTIKSGSDSNNYIAGRDIVLASNRGSVKYLDQAICAEVEKLKRKRFFQEFDRVGECKRLSRQLAEGEFLEGSAELRAWALAWCARLLARHDDPQKAEALLKLAKELGELEETKLAEAVILSGKDDKPGALSLLSECDTGASRSSALMIVAFHDGPGGALNWLQKAGYAVEDLDPDGKGMLLSYQLAEDRLDDALHAVSKLSDEDFDHTPVLHHLAGLARLLPTVLPQELRETVRQQVPFEAREFPLASEAEAIRARRISRQHFVEGAEVAEQLNCLRAAKLDDEYALWLELRDPTLSAHGRARLENKLRDRSMALGFVHYAFQFGIRVDRDKVDEDIERSFAIHGSMTNDAAMARMALAFAQPNAEAVADYITQYQTQLAAHIDTRQIQYRLIEMLARANRFDKAYELLDGLAKDGESDDGEVKLRAYIAEIQQTDPIEAVKQRYIASGNLEDLLLLVNELESHQRWDDVCEFAGLLFEETRTLSHAESLINALNKTHRSKSVVDFAKKNKDVVSLSGLLHMSYAWALFHEGEFVESRKVLSELSDVKDGTNFRALKLHLAIVTGDWNSLVTHIEEEYKNRDDRSAEELLKVGQLAQHLGMSNFAKDLVFAAVAKADDDPGILVTAYSIATSAGWEDNEYVVSWFEKAAELSDEDGPLHRISLKDIADQKPEWDRRESEIWQSLGQGKWPIFIAAESLNRSLIELTLLPALSNLNQTDPRRRSAVPAFSGRRRPSKLNLGAKTAAFDATTLLTLSFLGMLDVALDVFRTVYIPHSTLWWLFKEREKVAFHQPSRIASARKLQELLASGLLQRFTLTTTPSSDLSAQIGDSLAGLIAEAEKTLGDRNAEQHLVVRSGPVHRISGLMEEEADLSEHESVLSSCLSVVEKLRHKGQLTADQEKKARAYLQLHERPWPNQPVISDGATLYLDELSVTYFLHLDLFEKLQSAGLTVFIPPGTISEAINLIAYDRISAQVQAVIEHIRSTINSRIEFGQVKAGRMLVPDDSENSSVMQQPSLGLLSLAESCDLALIDDRFFNSKIHIAYEGSQVPIFSTLDLLDTLVETKVQTDETWFEYRTQLRRAGYFFIPLSKNELKQHLVEAEVSDGKLVETAELKAIRESILRIRMCDWLQLPDEAPWLDGMLKTLSSTLRELWIDDADIEAAIVRSDWIFEQFDIRGWAHSLKSENVDQLVWGKYASTMLLLIMPIFDVDKEIEGAYQNWVETRILDPLEELFPEAYDWLVGWYRNNFNKLVEIHASEGGSDD